jgi:two-component system chemotaxis sensor kinase CheA
LPGFSTAEKVTNVSGRGVGMDVVKTNVEKIGGTVDVQSTAGKGTTVKVKIPLTLAIIPALMMTSGGERFAIPRSAFWNL